jgi:hypothetical protein
MKNNMSQVSHRTWFPFILVGLTITLATGIWAWTSSDRSQAPPEIGVEAPTSLEYQAEIAQILQMYLDDDDLDTAYESLVDVRVPSDAQEVHLDLVIAFGKLVAGNESGAELLETVRSQHDWLP